MNLMTKFKKCPWNPITHGYITTTPKVATLVNIVPDFSTFAEIADDLELINPELYELSLERPVTKGVTYAITGNGYLRRIPYERSV